jgi:hypothetical protein
MPDPKEPTRSELADALAKATAMLEQQGKLIEELKAAPPAASSTSDLVQLEILKVLQELRSANQRTASQHYVGPELPKTPYSGYARATEACVDNILLQDGEFHPVKREKGEVFQIDKDQLWSDDPFEPVTLKGIDSSGVPVVELNKIAMASRGDFRFRRHTSVTEDPTLKRASEY